MSVIVKGMQMPPTCSECQLAYDFMACVVTGNRWYDQDNIDAGFDSDNARLPDCPLKEIPENHGRLIDEDALLRESLADGAYGYVSTKQIYDAPTVIEADRS